MNAYEVEVKVKLRVYAFEPSDASDAVEQVMRESECLGAEVLDLSFTSIKEI